MRDKTRPGIKYKKNDVIAGYLFILPTIIGLYVFYLYPMARSLILSFFKSNGLTAPEFKGLANYARLLADPLFKIELFNTFFFVVVSVPLILLLAIGMAYMLNQKVYLRGVSRTIIFLPYVILPIVCAHMWIVIFNSKYGLVNNFLIELGLRPLGWMSNPVLARIVIIIALVWSMTGYYVIILLGGLQSISPQFYEAADLEGASPWTKFTRITVPLLSPQIFYCMILLVIFNLQMFDNIYVFGKGNPIVQENIRTLAFGIYESGFTFQELGYASAKAIVLAAIVFVLTSLQNKVQKKWVIYD